MGPRDIGEAVGVTGHIWRTEQKKIQMNGVSFPALASKQTHTHTHRSKCRPAGETEGRRREEYRVKR